MRNRKHLNATLAVAYCRVSTTAERQALGMAAQRRAIERYASQHGLTVASWHQDEVSGASELAARPGLVGALQAVKAERAGVLLVAKRDRFSRDSLETAAVELELRRAGAELVSADGLANGQDAASRLMAAVLQGVAEFERATIASRIKAALAVKKARGQRVSRHVPYGCQLGADGSTLDPQPAELATLARMRELRASGLSLRLVSETLAAEGRVNRAGHPFDLQAVRRWTLP